MAFLLRGSAGFSNGDDVQGFMIFPQAESALDLFIPEGADRNGSQFERDGLQVDVLGRVTRFYMNVTGRPGFSVPTGRSLRDRGDDQAERGLRDHLLSEGRSRQVRAMIPGGDLLKFVAFRQVAKNSPVIDQIQFQGKGRAGGGRGAETPFWIGDSLRGPKQSTDHLVGQWLVDKFPDRTAFRDRLLDGYR